MKNPSTLFWSKLALKELLNNRRFSLFFLFNFALGLVGFIALDSFKESLDAHLGKNSDGKMSVVKIELNPKVLFSNNFKISEDEMSKMQDRSHRYCFIANSLSDEVKVLIN